MRFYSSIRTPRRIEIPRRLFELLPFPVPLCCYSFSYSRATLSTPGRHLLAVPKLHFDTTNSSIGASRHWFFLGSVGLPGLHNRLSTFPSVRRLFQDYNQVIERQSSSLLCGTQLTRSEQPLLTVGVTYEVLPFNPCSVFLLFSSASEYPERLCNVFCSSYRWPNGILLAEPTG